jgi:hypothetical protein
MTPLDIASLIFLVIVVIGAVTGIIIALKDDIKKS